MQFLRSGGLLNGSLLRSAEQSLGLAGTSWTGKNLSARLTTTTCSTAATTRQHSRVAPLLPFSRFGWTTTGSLHNVGIASTTTAAAATRNSCQSPLMATSRAFHSQPLPRILAGQSSLLTTPLVSSSLPSSSPFQTNLGAVSYLSSYTGGGGARPPPRPPAGGSRIAQGVGLVGAASVLLGKTKYVLAALKLTKLASLGSMLFTIGTYSMFFGLPYAVGMVGLVAIHEAGHAAVMLQRGIPFSPMVFVPFVGAAVAMKRMPRDAWEDALVGYGGPALGSLGAGAVAVAAHGTDSQLLYALADFGFMINLFNLLPIGMMDGGRISGAISPWIGVGGLGLGGMLAYSGEIHNPIFYLILLAGGYETFMRFYDPTRLPPNYYRITPFQRGTITVAYVGLICALLAAMDANRKYRKPPEVLMREQQMEKSWDMR